jgi:hypothetical protein
MLIDELTLNDQAIVEPGLDHFYLDPQFDVKFLALTKVVLKEISLSR